jgi:hypothetical protein
MFRDEPALLEATDFAPAYPKCHYRQRNACRPEDESG